MKAIIFLECPVCGEPVKFGRLRVTSENVVEVEFECPVCGYGDVVLISVEGDKIEVR